VTPTAPIDATHAESVHAVGVIRAEVARLRAGVAAWQMSRSDAGESKTTKTTKKAGD
jgi:uncharacterized small protein (DUF1192 family)